MPGIPLPLDHRICWSIPPESPLEETSPRSPHGFRQAREVLSRGCCELLWILSLAPRLIFDMPTTPRVVKTVSRTSDRV